MTFQEWMAARPEIFAARDAARQNPAGALAPLPALQAPNLWLNTERHDSKEVLPLPPDPIISRSQAAAVSKVRDEESERGKAAAVLSCSIWFMRMLLMHASCDSTKISFDIG